MELEPLNMSYDEEAVYAAVSLGLNEFYSALTGALTKINLDKVMKRKNPYLYRAKGINDAAQIVSGILSAYVSSSEETIFGNVFFEPLAIAVSGGQKAVTEGIDITIDKDNTIYSIAVKSGPSVFNADSRKRQEQNFQSAQKRAQQARKAYFPVVGYGYGKKRIAEKNEKFYKELAGQDFWTWLTGDETFYTKIIAYMGTKPDEFVKRFNEAYDKALNRILRDFILKYCDEDGAINWEKLVKYNSGTSR